MINIIRSMYAVSKSSLKFSNNQTPYFDINRGVKQGDSLSPTLFNIYINEIPELFIREECFPLILENSSIGSLMFADDLVILSESEVGLQKSLDSFAEYCDKWQLTVNCKKTKTMVLTNSFKNVDNISFKYKNNILEVVKEFKFLGNIITRTGNLVPAAQALSNKSLKVMSAIRAYTSSLHEIPANLSSHLFDSLVRPILTYNAEIWYMDIYRTYYNATVRANLTNNLVDELSFIEKSPLEKVHNKFTKFTLGLKKCACNISARSELGRLPIDCFVKKQSLLYEDRLYYEDTSNILKECFSLTRFLHERGIYTWYTYINHVRKNSKIVVDKDTNRSHKNVRGIKYKNHFHYKYLETYNNKIESLEQNSKLQLFKNIKTDHNFEFYLKYPIFETRKLICKFRTSDHPLAIESGRYKNIPRDQRLCNLCKVLEDEAHFFLSCQTNKNLRCELFDDFDIDVKDSSINKLNKILNPNTFQQVKSLGTFIRRSLELRTGGT